MIICKKIPNIDSWEPDTVWESYTYNNDDDDDADDNNNNNNVYKRSVADTNYY